MQKAGRMGEKNKRYRVNHFLPSDFVGGIGRVAT